MKPVRKLGGQGKREEEQRPFGKAHRSRENSHTSSPPIRDVGLDGLGSDLSDVGDAEDTLEGESRARVSRAIEG